MAVFNFSGAVYPPPPIDEFSWVNQGTSTIEEFSGNHLMLVNGAATEFRIRVQSIPSPSSTWTLTAQFEQWMWDTTFQQCGLILRDSVSGRHVAFTLAYNVDQIVRQNWTNASTYASVVNLFAMPPNLPRKFWLRIVNDGANNSFQVSLTEGETWIEVLNESETNWLSNPADQCGYGADCNSTGDFYFSVLNYNLDN